MTLIILYLVISKREKGCFTFVFKYYNSLRAQVEDWLEGRWLLDSVSVANETLEEVKRKKKECVVFEVDYEKAYDSASWEFIYYMLGRLGFCGKWNEWIKNCLKSSSIYVFVNEIPTTEFKPKKGLRQWDPLAPFFFLIAVEGVVRQTKEKKLVKIIVIGERWVNVSMLQ